MYVQSSNEAFEFDRSDGNPIPSTSSSHPNLKRELVPGAAERDRRIGYEINAVLATFLPGSRILTHDEAL